MKIHEQDEKQHMIYCAGSCKFAKNGINAKNFRILRNSYLLLLQRP